MLKIQHEYITKSVGDRTVFVLNIMSAAMVIMLSTWLMGCSATASDRICVVLLM